NPFIERFNVDRKQPFIHLNTIFIASNIILHLFHYLAKPLLTVPTDVFTYWVKEFLIPNLHENTVIVMDNAYFHKSKDMQKIIEDSGHILLYLHSPAN
ncbi:transposase, partial [Candidatus Cyrtobacter comes]|uniref:transposase n=1 Tax=Candidatus Cyrtobacter comes TaxID=675776 RepID=UPI0030B920AA